MKPKNISQEWTSERYWKRARKYVIRELTLCKVLFIILTLIKKHASFSSDTWDISFLGDRENSIFRPYLDIKDFFLEYDSPSAACFRRDGCGRNKAYSDSWKYPTRCHSLPCSGKSQITKPLLQSHIREESIRPLCWKYLLCGFGLEEEALLDDLRQRKIRSIWRRWIETKRWRSHYI